MKKWRCTVCNYIHVGEEPPDVCPVCGADKSKFVEETEAAPEAETAQKTAASAEDSKYKRLYGMITDLMAKHHAHPVSVHIPNGLLPVSVFFILLAVLFGLYRPEIAAFYNLIVVVLAMPLVLFSGYVEWRKKYGGNLTKVFLIKMVCGGIVTLAGLILVIWRMIHPDVVFSGGRMLYTLIALIMVGAAGIAGFLGGKLVFKEFK